MKKGGVLLMIGYRVLFSMSQVLLPLQINLVSCRSLYSLSLIKVSVLMVVLYSGPLITTFSFYSLYFLRST